MTPSTIGKDESKRFFLTELYFIYQKTVTPLLLWVVVVVAYKLYQNNCTHLKIMTNVLLIPIILYILEHNKINIYIRVYQHLIHIMVYENYIYLMPWNLVCNPWVSWNFYKITIIRQLLYCTWFAINPQSDLVTTNTVIIYFYI